MAINETPLLDEVALDVFTPGDNAFILGLSVLGEDSFGDGTEAYGWEQYTCSVLNVNIKRGGSRSGASNAIDVGTMSVNFFNDADPTIDPNIHPNTPVRLRMVADDEIIFTGTIVDTNVTYDYDKVTSTERTFTSIIAVDAVQSLANTMRYGAGALDEFESWEDRIERLSASANTSIVLPGESGESLIYNYSEIAADLDGWELLNGVPAGETQTFLGRVWYHTPTFINRPLLWWTTHDSLPHTTPIGYGFKRLITGLEIGKTYRLNAKAQYFGHDGATTPKIKDFQLGVEGIGWASSGDITTGWETQLPYYEFEATNTYHYIAVRNSASVTRTVDYPSEGSRMFSLMFWDIRLEELGTPIPYRLQSVKYESTLLNHFTMACDSVGAYWWVDKENQVQFTRALPDQGNVTIFSDNCSEEGMLSYISKDVSFDAKNTVNELNLVNHGMKEDPENPSNTLVDDINHGFTDITSIASWGSHSANLDVSLYEGDEWAGSVERRANEILEQLKDPRRTITQIRWNAQEDISRVAELDIYGIARVIHKGFVQESRILGITHDISPKRWIVTLDLVNDAGKRWEKVEEDGL